MTIDIDATELRELPEGGLWLATGVHAVLLNFYEDNVERDGLLPKSAVDPIRLKSVLPYLILLKKTQQHDWQFTVVGTEIVAGYGEDFSGSMLSALDYSPCRNVYEQMISECSETRQPHLCVGRMRYPEREVLDTQKSVFPISDNGSTISHCLFGLSVDRRPRSVDTFYKPFSPIGAVDQLFKITERAFTEGTDSWFVSHVRKLSAGQAA